MNIVEIISSRLRILIDILDIATKCGPYIKDILRGINDVEIVNYEKSHDALERTIEKMKNMKKIDSLADAVVLYQIFETADGAVYDLSRIMMNDGYFRLATFNMSETRIQEIKYLRESMEKKTAILRVKAIADDDIIIPHVIKTANIEEKPGIGAVFIEENSSLINKLTTSVMRFIYSRVPQDIRDRLNSIIEMQKDILLGSSRYDFARYNSDQQMHSYGLVPKSESMPFADLGLGPDLESLLATGAIILDKSSNNPIEFNIKGIMEVEGALNPAAGLNKKFIERSLTIRRLPETHGKSKPVRVIGDSSAESFVVIDTLDGGHNWRQLVDSKSRDAIGVPKQVVLGYLAGPSTRPDDYNEIIHKNIFDNCYDPMADTILKSYEELKFMHAPADAVKNALKTDLDLLVEHGIPYENPKEFEDAVCGNRPGVEKLMLARLMSEDKRMLDNPEFALTFLSRLEGMVSSFMKEIVEKFVSAKISDKTFSERSGENLQNYLVETARDIFAAAIDELDRNNTWNTYDISLKEHFIFKKYLTM